MEDKTRGQTDRTRVRETKCRQGRRVLCPPSHATRSPSSTSHNALQQSAIKQSRHTTAGRHLQLPSRIVSCSGPAGQFLRSRLPRNSTAGSQFEFRCCFSPLLGLSCGKTEVHENFYRCVINTFRCVIGTSLASVQKQCVCVFVCVCVCVCVFMHVC